MQKFTTVRIPQPLAERLRPYAESLGWSETQFMIKCIQAMCDMIEDPGMRTLPHFITMLDATKGPIIQLTPEILDTHRTARVAETPSAASDVQKIASAIAGSPELRALFEQQISIRKGGKAKRPA